MRAWMVRYVRRMSWRVAPCTPLIFQRAAVAFDQPEKGVKEGPRTGNKSGLWLHCSKMETQSWPNGKGCSLPFFVTLAGIVRVHRSVEFVEIPFELVERPFKFVELLFVIHED